MRDTFDAASQLAETMKKPVMVEEAEFQDNDGIYGAFNQSL